MVELLRVLDVNEPFIVEPCAQKARSDCWAACLAMLTGRTYTDVVAAAPRQWRSCRSGLGIREIVNAAKRLKVVLRYTATPPDDDDIGMLFIHKEDDPEAHVVMWLNGVIFDPSPGLLYTDAAAFLLTYGWQVQWFLWREE